MTNLSSTATAKLPSPARRIVLTMALLLALPFAFAAQSAHAANPAEAFVDQNIQKGLNILGDKSLTDQQRRDKFRSFLLGLTDLKRIALFTLGPAKRTASDAEKAQFVDAFRDFAVAIYESRLSTYSDQTLKVTGSQQTSRGDTIVNAVLIDPHAASAADKNLPVAFRVSNDDGKPVVIDVNVLGVWLAIEERDQFSSFLGDHNNNVSALIAHLKELTAKMRAGGTLPEEAQPQKQQ
ncbi:MAG TPA: ABC transporter substrate-binding protein [Rhizomicrobium sp.]|nr:ABC transporter substrate-binding protein [Rhizomicrobium sp.]